MTASSKVNTQKRIKAAINAILIPFGRSFPLFLSVMPHMTATAAKIKNIGSLTSVHNALPISSSMSGHIRIHRGGGFFAGTHREDNRRGTGRDIAARVDAGS